jgi:hypothetical protein
MKLLRLVVPGALLVAGACGSTGNGGLPGDVGTFPLDGGSFVTGDAAGASGLDAHIEQNHVEVTVVTVGCAGACATVQAVGTGGNPPYSYAWEDGATDPIRKVCPGSDTAYAVKVTDTGTSGELARPPQTARATVTADVIACPDGGSLLRDSGAAVPSADACAGGIRNPSIEGTPQPVVVGLWDAPGWTQCPFFGGYPAALGGATTSITGSMDPAPTNGGSYAVLQALNLDAGIVAIPGFGQTLCAPLAGNESFLLDAMWADANAGNPAAAPPDADTRLRIFGGASACNETEPLWTSPALTKSWATYCVPLAPAQAAAAVTFDAITNANAARVLVDHIVPVTSCP